MIPGECTYLGIRFCLQLRTAVLGRKHPPSLQGLSFLPPPKRWSFGGFAQSTGVHHQPLRAQKQKWPQATREILAQPAAFILTQPAERVSARALTHLKFKTVDVSPILNKRQMSWSTRLSWQTEFLLICTSFTDLKMPVMIS